MRDVFFHEVWIDFITWDMWHNRRKRQRIVRMAAKGTGWMSLDIPNKPGWLLAREVQEQTARNWAIFVSSMGKEG